MVKFNNVGTCPNILGSDLSRGKWELGGKPSQAKKSLQVVLMPWSEIIAISSELSSSSVRHSDEAVQ